MCVSILSLIGKYQQEVWLSAFLLRGRIHMVNMAFADFVLRQAILRTALLYHIKIK